MVGTGNVELLRTQELTRETRRILFEWSSDPFCAARSGLIWRSKTDHLLIRYDDRLACHVGLIRDTVQVGERAIPVGGIGDVITGAEFQGRGFAKRQFTRLLISFGTIGILHAQFSSAFLLCDH